MKLLLDANLSPRLVRELEFLYPGSSHVDQLGLRQSPDIEIWQCPKSNGYAIASKDDDFQPGGERRLPPRPRLGFVASYRL